MVFSLDRQQGSIPKRLKNSKDIAAMERILQFIASKKKDGVYYRLWFPNCRVLKEVVVLVNESTIRCNEYLNALMKMEEIVRTQTKKVHMDLCFYHRDSYILWIQIVIISI